MRGTFKDILDYIENLPVFNTHAHQQLSLEAGGFDLEKLFRNSYIHWCGIEWGDSPADRQNLLDKIRFDSFYLWTERALQEIYHLDSTLSAAGWDRLSSQIREAHAQPGYWADLLTRQCRYERVVEDAYWDPGSDCNLTGFFTPTFRINAFFFGYHPEIRDHDGNNALHLYRDGKPVKSLEEYVTFMQGKILEKRRQGCVALKIPIAYDRSLDFKEVPFDRAAIAFENLKTSLGSEDIKAFQDYLFFEACWMAAELDIPLQIHTGMGKLERSNASWLKEAIQVNHRTKFVLLHCSFPWIQDAIVLARSFKNVFPDLSWLPQLSSHGARQAILDLIEAGAVDKMGWGCDTWTPEESYGSLLAFRQVLATALSEKVESGYFGLEDALLVARKITSENAHNLYRREDM